MHAVANASLMLVGEDDLRRGVAAMSERLPPCDARRASGVGAVRYDPARAARQPGRKGTTKDDQCLRVS